MEKRTLNHHASTVLAKCEATGEYILGQYDPGYPGKNKQWIGRVKLLGGNYFSGKDLEVSPLDTLCREIREEFSGARALEGEMASQQNIEKFAKQKDIDYVRWALLDIDLSQSQDYFLYHPGQGDAQGALVIQSVYRAKDVTEDAIEIVKHYSETGKALSNEGLVVVKSLDEIREGRPFCQGITGLVIGQTEGIHIKNSLDDLFVCAPIGLPRSSYEAYSDIFQYRDHSK
jgi:hypothetical protein